MSKKLRNNRQRYVRDERQDSTRGLDLSNMRRASFANLKSSSETISLRVPMWMLHEIKRLANQRDVPYQSWIKMILAEHLEQRSRRDRHRAA